jgi:hypothetical protein
MERIHTQEQDMNTVIPTHTEPPQAAPPSNDSWFSMAMAIWVQGDRSAQTTRVDTPALHVR